MIKQINMKTFKTLVVVLLSITMFQCDNDDDAGKDLPIADFQFLVEGALVTFNGKVSEDTTSFMWDFGDGNSSTEEDPVHAFAAAGDYIVSLTANSPNGTFVETKTVTILPSIEILLTGGPAKPNGKAWKLKPEFTVGIEGASFITDEMAIFLSSEDNLLANLGLGNSYEDKFIFVHDGSYRVDNVDGESLMGLPYASNEFPAQITQISYDTANLPLCEVTYTPRTDATWELHEGDFYIEGVFGPVLLTNKKQLILGEYLAFKEKVINIVLKDITETTMNVAISIATNPAIYEKPVLLFHLSLESL